MKKYIFILTLLSLSACSFQQNNKPAEDQIPLSDHPQSMAALYNYYAAEYGALSHQAFNIARDRVDDMCIEYPDRNDMAIVVDIDETLLDNSPHQALMIVQDSSYPYMWNEWCDLAGARAVPGALEFLQYANKRGFKIFYVSNRKAKYVKESSMRNLKLLGFPQLQDDHFLLRLEKSENNPNPSDKQDRRDTITANGFEIVLLIGDNLGDFYSDYKGSTERAHQMNSFRESFGRKFVVLPNAMYGNWPGSIGIKDSEGMDSLLKNMVKPFTD